jgi:hypothetical protein
MGQKAPETTLVRAQTDLQVALRGAVSLWASATTSESGGWVVLRSELLRKNVYEQETWSPMKRNPNLRLHYVERNIVRYGRQYILSCSSLVPEQKVNPNLCYRFFNSFRVIREPQPQ